MSGWFKRHRVVGAVVALLVIAAAGGGFAFRASTRAATPAPQPVTLEFSSSDLAVVESRALTRWLPISGTLQPVNQTIVKAKVSGEIRQVAIREGEAVKAGQVLLRFDTSDLEAKLTDRTGALESSRAQLALAEKTRTQNQALLRQKFISQNAYDSADSNLAVSQGSLKSNEAQQQLARNALRDAVVTAPLSGIVAKRHVQPGEKVTFDSPLFTIVDLAKMELQAMVPANDIPEISAGMRVELAIDGYGARHFEGQVERINPTTEPGTRAILVFVQIPNPDAALKGGMFATGRIKLAAGSPVDTLPAVAVRIDAGQPFVWTIDGGKLVRRNVAIGRRDDETSRVELQSALPPGAKVLAARFDNLKDGLPAVVRPVNTETAARPG